MIASSAIGYTDVTTIDQPRDVRLLMRNVNGESYVAFQNAVTWDWLKPIPCSHTPEAIEAKRAELSYIINKGRDETHAKSEQRLRDMIEAGAEDIPESYKTGLALNHIGLSGAIDIAALEAAAKRWRESGGDGRIADMLYSHAPVNRGMSYAEKLESQLRHERIQANALARDLDYLTNEHKRVLKRNEHLEKVAAEDSPVSEKIASANRSLAKAIQSIDFINEQCRQHHQNANAACEGERIAKDELKHVRQQMRLLLKAVYGASAVMAVAAFLHFAFGV